MPCSSRSSRSSRSAPRRPPPTPPEGLRVPRAAHGGAYEVPVHPAYVTSLRFAGKIGSANTSAMMDKDYEIRADGADGLLVRPKAPNPGDANVNIQVGPSRISALLRTKRDPKEACALVTFKATTIEEAIERQVTDAVAKRTAALEAELVELRAEQTAPRRR
jgi:hypothetical protein